MIVWWSDTDTCRPPVRGPYFPNGRAPRLSLRAERCERVDDLAGIESDAPICLDVCQNDSTGPSRDIGRRDRKSPRAIGIFLADVVPTRLEHRSKLRGNVVTKLERPNNHLIYIAEDRKRERASAFR